MVTKAELDEVFPNPSVREVAFEIRFAPRLRIRPEIWRIQEKLAETYPQIGEDNVPQAGGRTIDTYTFANPSLQRLVKVSQENFIVVFNRYTTFEDFKAEVIAQTLDFSKEFDVGTYTRVGLRYVNHIELPTEDGIRLLQRYVNVPIDFERFDPDTVEQLLSEFRLKVGRHRLTIRGALIQVPTGSQQLLYILDLDCYGLGRYESSELSDLLDEFHDQIQNQFLEHIKNEYKTIMRRRS